MKDNFQCQHAFILLGFIYLQGDVYINLVLFHFLYLPVKNVKSAILRLTNELTHDKDAELLVWAPES